MFIMNLAFLLVLAKLSLLKASSVPPVEGWYLFVVFQYPQAIEVCGGSSYLESCSRYSGFFRRH